MDRIRKLINAYWIVAVITVVTSVIATVFITLESKGSGITQYDMATSYLSMTFQTAAYLIAFGAAAECLYFIAATLGGAVVSDSEEDRKLD